MGLDLQPDGLKKSLLGLLDTAR